MLTGNVEVSPQSILKLLLDEVLKITDNGFVPKIFDTWKNGGINGKGVGGGVT